MKNFFLSLLTPQGILGLIVTLLVVVPVGLNIERLMEQEGWDDVLTELLSTSTAQQGVPETPIIDTPQWHWLVLALGLGGSITFWISRFLRRKESKKYLGDNISSIDPPESAASLSIGNPRDRASEHNQSWWQIPVRINGAERIVGARVEAKVINGDRYDLNWEISGGRAAQQLDLELGRTYWIPVARRFRELLPEPDYSSEPYIPFPTAITDNAYFLGAAQNYPIPGDYEFYLEVRADNIPNVRSRQYTITIPSPKHDNTKFCLRLVDDFL